MSNKDSATPHRSADARKAAVVPTVRKKIPATLDNNVPILIQECKLNEKETLLERRKSSNLLGHSSDLVNECSPKGVPRHTPNRLQPMKRGTHMNTSSTHGKSPQRSVLKRNSPLVELISNRFKNKRRITRVKELDKETSPSPIPPVAGGNLDEEAQSAERKKYSEVQMEIYAKAGFRAQKIIKANFYSRKQTMPD